MDERDQSHVDDLIGEARAEARIAVKARLRERFERELLARAEARLTAAPPGPEPPAEPAAPASAEPQKSGGGSGLWVYCVAGEHHPGPSGEAAGVGDAPYVVRAAGLSALVSSVPLDEFGSEGLTRNLNDLAWLESMARAHEAVLDSALCSGAVVPMRVCTIYSTEERVREQLQHRRAEFSEALGWLSDRAEWGVKILAAREHAEELARAANGTGESPADSGGAYLARKQEQRRLRDEVDSLLDEAVSECHARLEEWATASQLLPPQRRELAGYDGDMVLNAAYLVDDDRSEAMAGIVAELGRQYADVGLTFELTGPWPAYHFVGRLQSLEEPAA
jgi:hypothetical protein